MMPGNSTTESGYTERADTFNSFAHPQWSMPLPRDIDGNPLTHYKDRYKARMNGIDPDQPLINPVDLPALNGTAAWPMPTPFRPSSCQYHVMEETIVCYAQNKNSNKGAHAQPTSIINWGTPTPAVSPDPLPAGWYCCDVPSGQRFVGGFAVHVQQPGSLRTVARHPNRLKRQI
jgi:hypothetical protein